MPKEEKKMALIRDGGIFGSYRHIPEAELKEIRAREKKSLIQVLKWIGIVIIFILVFLWLISG